VNGIGIGVSCGIVMPLIMRSSGQGTRLDKHMLAARKSNDSEQFSLLRCALSPEPTALCPESAGDMLVAPMRNPRGPRAFPGREACVSVLATHCHARQYVTAHEARDRSTGERTHCRRGAGAIQLI